MGRYDALKERVYTGNMDLQRHGLVLFTFGNVSAIDRGAGVIAIKPSGVPYASLRPEDMVVVDLRGQVVEGRLKPSSDTPTHLVLYTHFPQIAAVAHTHSPYATAWAQAGCAIPVLGTTHADHLHVPVPCTDFMEDAAIQKEYEIETGYQITRTFAALSADEVEMVLVAGHGPFTWGKSVDMAVQNSVILEELAKIALWTLQIKPVTLPLKKSLIEKHHRRKHGPDAYYGQAESRA